MAQFLEQIADALGDVASKSFSAEVKTNLGPAIPIFSADADPNSPSIASRLGIKASLIVRDRRGDVVATYGDPPPTNYMLVTAFAIAIAVAVAVSVKLVRSV